MATRIRLCAVMIQRRVREYLPVWRQWLDDLNQHWHKMQKEEYNYDMSMKMLRDKGGATQQLDIRRQSSRLQLDVGRLVVPGTTELTDAGQTSMSPGTAATMWALAGALGSPKAVRKFVGSPLNPSFNAKTAAAQRKREEEQERADRKNPGNYGTLKLLRKESSRALMSQQSPQQPAAPGSRTRAEVPMWESVLALEAPVPLEADELAMAEEEETVEEQELRVYREKKAAIEKKFRPRPLDSYIDHSIARPDADLAKALLQERQRILQAKLHELRRHYFQERRANHESWRVYRGQLRGWLKDAMKAEERSRSAVKMTEHQHRIRLSVLQKPPPEFHEQFSVRLTDDQMIQLVRLGHINAERILSKKLALDLLKGEYPEAALTDERETLAAQGGS